ncbi:MAG: 50S ribosomal protein L10 [Candidatus Cloacimonetes bacterium]|nr:50S ribosomal protein L10 [Candidatus Cloacimonadota bacterium]
MVQAYKIEEVQQIKSRLENAKAIVLVDYKGVNIEEVNELRNRLRNSRVDYFVSKNTFIKIALHDLGITELDDNLLGPTAVAISKQDEIAPARELVNFKKELLKDKSFPSLKVGLIGGNLMTPEQLLKISDLPGKQVLIAMVLQGMNAPLTGLVGVLQGIIRKFVYVVDSIAKKETN